MVKDTGERVIPDYMTHMNKLVLEHTARYQFALNYVKGRVLDLSCGAGYGTHMIAKEMKDEIDEIIGVDIDPEIIKYAKGRYYHPKSAFVVADATEAKLKEKVGTFDTIVSFETIEHIEQEESLLNNYDQLLNDGGTLIVSTPFGEGRGKPCGSPFHVHQLKPEEFIELFQQYETAFYYQKGVLIEPARPDLDYPLGIAVCQKV
ncbi:class I SAM-dependent methyltransferase [Sediminibacillus massiliensis]|uniref:class I SAM-dependent methyltransferase n=1 Tax=Sediminibacillus massiliensis TaxID=1926277 RepID=UPI0009886ABE|nr:class I SAM-dependent methyltransferase [Sediminibacillus massiliensis]